MCAVAVAVSPRDPVNGDTALQNVTSLAATAAAAASPSASLPVSTDVTEMSVSAATSPKASVDVTEVSVSGASQQVSADVTEMSVSAAVTEVAASTDIGSVPLSPAVPGELAGRTENAVVDEGDALVDNVPGSPHTATSSISSPSELSADISDQPSTECRLPANTMTTIPLVRTPGSSDTPLHITPRRPLPQSESAAADTTDSVTDVKHADTSPTVDTVSELSVAGDMSETSTGVERLQGSGVQPSTSNGTVTAAAAAAGLQGTHSEALADISDEVQLLATISQASYCSAKTGKPNGKLICQGRWGK